MAIVADANGVGLSPLARGTQRVIGHILNNRRFIPAGVGNVTAHAGTMAANPVYPRWRGERTKYILLFYNKFIHTKQSTDIFATN